MCVCVCHGVCVCVCVRARARMHFFGATRKELELRALAPVRALRVRNLANHTYVHYVLAERHA